MTYLINGTTTNNIKLYVINEATDTIEKVSTVAAGNYTISKLTSGNKTILGRNTTTGEALAYGNVSTQYGFVGTDWANFSVTDARYGIAIGNPQWPCILYDSDAGIYKMWYNNTSSDNTVVYCTSSNGTNWSNYTNSIGKSNFTYDNRGIYSQYVIKDGSTYKMWYIGSGTDWYGRICYATSTDGIAWANHQMVQDRNRQGVYDVSIATVGLCVIKDGSTYRMWYVGQDTTTFKARIVNATSTDGINWSIPTLSVYHGTDNQSLSYPIVIKDGSIYRMWYSYTDNEGPIYYTTSSDGITWATGTQAFVKGSQGTYDTYRINTGSVLSYSTATSSFKIWYSGVYSNGAYTAICTALA